MFQLPPTDHHREDPSDVRPFVAEQVDLSLMPDEIIVDTELHSRRRVLEVSADAVARRYGLDAVPIFRALWRRELVGSTALGHGVAIPHARIYGVDRPVTVFLRPRLAVDFAAPDGKPVRCFLAILVPSNGDTDDHLALLARVAEMFADVGFRERLAYAGSKAEVTKTFSDWASRSSSAA